MDYPKDRARSVRTAEGGFGLLFLALATLTLIALAGWYLWNNAVVDALGSWKLDSAPALALFGFLAGTGSFFAPCAFSLFPGYITYYMSLVKSPNPGSEFKVRLSLLYGGSAAAGAVIFFALVGLALTLLGQIVSPILINTKPLVAAAIVVVGIIQLSDWTLQTPSLSLRGSEGGPFAALFVYGFGYGLASTGCTLPVYAAAVLIPLSTGQTSAALITFLSFASAMAFLMMGVSLLIGLAHSGIVARFQSSTAFIKRLSGIVLILVGLYSGYYYLKAGM